MYGVQADVRIGTGEHLFRKVMTFTVPPLSSNAYAVLALGVFVGIGLVIVLASPWCGCCCCTTKRSRDKYEQLLYLLLDIKVDSMALTRAR